MARTLRCVRRSSGLNDAEATDTIRVVAERTSLIGFGYKSGPNNGVSLHNALFCVDFASFPTSAFATSLDPTLLMSSWKR